MAANNNPLYVLTPIATFAQLTAADTTMSGTGANVVLVFTAGSNGAFVNKLVWQPISTSGSITTNAAAGRVYLNNGSSVGTATNNALFKEISLPAITVSQTETVGAIGYELPLNIQLPATYTIYVSATSFVANSQWNVVCFGGSY